MSLSDIDPVCRSPLSINYVEEANAAGFESDNLANSNPPTKFPNCRSRWLCEPPHVDVVSVERQVVANPLFKCFNEAASPPSVRWVIELKRKVNCSRRI